MKNIFTNKHFPVTLPAAFPCILGFNSKHFPVTLPAAFPCILGFNSKRINIHLAFSLKIKVLDIVFANFASSNSGYRIFDWENEKFYDFLKILLTQYNEGKLILGLYYSISFRLQIVTSGGFEYITFGGSLEFIFISENDVSFNILFNEIYEKIHSEFKGKYLWENCSYIVLLFQPIEPSGIKINVKNPLPLSLVSTLHPNIIYEVQKVNLLSCNQQRSYSTSTKDNSNDKIFIDKDKLLRDNLLKEIKENVALVKVESIDSSKLVKVAKVESLKPLKIIVNGIVFNLFNNELWIDFSSDVDYKEEFDRIQSILKDLDLTKKAYLNTRDLTSSSFPSVISLFINHFTDNEAYIKGNKVTRSYPWIYNVVVVNLYVYSLKMLIKMTSPPEEENSVENESDFKVNFEELTKAIYSKIDPSIRNKLRNRGISILQNIYTGYDTEFINKGDPMWNELISVQLAVNTKTLLKLPNNSEYELSSLNTLTGEAYKIDTSFEQDFKYFMIENTLNRCIKEIRSLKYKNDKSIRILIEGLQELNIPFIEKDDSFIFSFPRSPIQSYIYYEKDAKGFSIKDMINQSNLMGVDYLNDDHDKIIELLKHIYSINNTDEELHFDWNESENKKIEAIKTSTLPQELNIKKTTRSDFYSFTEDKVCVTKIRYNHFIAHWTPADLPMFNDFESLKKELVDIVNKCFISIGKPVVIYDTNVILRDSMLLAPQGHKSLDSVGTLYGEDFKKVDIAKDLTEDQKDNLTKDLTKDQKENLNLTLYIKENMDLLLKINKEKFEEYAIKDAIIPLIHANYMEDFNFKLNALGIPLTLSSLGKTFVKYKWDLKGYKGYQISQEYLLGDTSTTLTPKGLFAIGKTGLKLSFYIGNYKGGRNESFALGIDEEETKWIDYDLVSAYTTAMAALGNPDYNNGRVISVKDLEKMSFNEILYSYIILPTEFKFKEEIIYPSIACYINKDVVCFPSAGTAILTGPEYLLAKSQACKLNISEVYYLPFEKDKKGNLINQPFKDIIKEIQAERRKYPKGTIGNLINKEIGNSQYGSTVTGINSKMKFDVKSGKTIRMNAGFLSNPIIASWITGFIRSVVGECLDNLSKLNAKVISVTTDGFLTDVEDLESKLIGKKAYFINKLKSLERKIIDDNKFLFNNIETIKVEYNDLIDYGLKIALFSQVDYGMKKENLNQITSLLNELKTSHFDLIDKIKLIISQLKWEGNDSLLKEYEKIRLDLSGDPSGLEIKKIDTGLISGGTRQVIGRYSIKALTGFQSKNYTNEELFYLFREILGNDDKYEEFIEFSLRSALDIYKKGGHATPIHRDKIFRLQYDNKRLIVVPKEHENTTNLSDKMFFTVPVPDIELSSDLRFLMNYDKRSLYSKFTSSLSGNKYKNYTDIAVRNFIKGLLSNPPKYNLDNDWESYSEIIEFVKGFDSNIKISKSSISHLKGRKMIFKSVPRNKETLKFVEYVKVKYKDFNENDFFK